MPIPSPRDRRRLEAIAHAVQWELTALEEAIAVRDAAQRALTELIDRAC